MAKVKPKSLFWDNVIRAAEAEPRKERVLRGASGFSHPLVALGVDEPRRRVIIVSGEGDARSAALARGDIQAAMTSASVVMVRPVAMNLGFIARQVSEVLGRAQFGSSDIVWLNENTEAFQQRGHAVVEQIGPHLRQGVLTPFGAIPLNILGVLKDVLQQLSLVDTSPAAKQQTGTKNISIPIPTVNFSRLAVLDPVAADRQMGVCSIPLYELTENEVEDLQHRRNVDRARHVLKRHDVLQYFFPAPDQLALGLLDREPVNVGEIVSRLTQTPHLGHPFGPPEIIDTPLQLNEMIAALQDKGLLVEGEAEIEVTGDGRSVRARVAFKPREGLISKLLQRFSIKVDLSLPDLFKSKNH